MSTITLSAVKRENNGKAANKGLRKEGRLPAVVYGGKDEAVSISLDHKELYQVYSKGWLTSKTVELNVDGKAINVLPREVQLHPVSDQPLHVDFLRLEKGDKVRVNVPIKFVGLERSPGIKRGGVLNKVRRAVELICPADNIPTGIEADISALKIKESLHYSKLVVPADCTPTITDRDFTVATISGRVKKEEEAEAVEAEGAAEESAEE